MSASVTLKNVEEVKALLVGLTGHIEEVNRLSQNAMAYQVRDAEKAQMQSDLDRPTPFSINAVLYKKYGVSSLAAPNVPGAAVYMADAFRAGSRVGPDQWLGVQIEGGVTAGPRRSEKILQSKGWMPTDKVWVPAVGCPLDRHGNVRGADISAMLTSLGANPYGRRTPGSKRKVPQAYFLIGDPGNEEGVFRQVGSTYVPFIWFVPRQEYKKRFDFYGRADTEINTSYMGHVSHFIDEALKHL
jgi:hypothetical protein